MWRMGAKGDNNSSAYNDTGIFSIIIKNVYTLNKTVLSGNIFLIIVPQVMDTAGNPHLRIIITRIFLRIDLCKLPVAQDVNM